jgi:hypothetical protein
MSTVNIMANRFRFPTFEKLSPNYGELWTASGVSDFVTSFADIKHNGASLR